MTETPDWAVIIERLESVGVTRGKIAAAMGSQLTDRMIRWYKLGSEPAYFRGIGLVKLWELSFKSPVPMKELIRGHRAAPTEPVSGPAVQNLPQWPVAEVKRKPGRPRKAA